MTNTAQPADQLDLDVEPAKLSSMLNVLTILTFIGSGIALISIFTNFFTAQKNYDRAIENTDKIRDAQNTVKNLTGMDAVEISRKALEYRMPIFFLSLIGIALCVFGAVTMRRLKRNGFWSYLIGEILPVVVSLVFIGSTAVGPYLLVFNFVVPVVFIALYASQLKSLQ
jgi:hypothetical protein